MKIKFICYFQLDLPLLGKSSEKSQMGIPQEGAGSRVEVAGSRYEETVDRKEQVVDKKEQVPFSSPAH